MLNLVILNGVLSVLKKAHVLRPLFYLKKVRLLVMVKVVE